MQAKPITTDSILMNIHGELSSKLRAAHGKPVFVTISYVDDTKPVDKQIQHWVGTNHDFPVNRLMPSLLEIGRMAQRDILPKTSIKQIKHKKPRGR